MTIQELKDLVRLKIAGQGTMVDAGGALPPVLNGILDTLAATQNVESVVVTVDGGEGTPSADATFADGVLTLAFHNLKGEKGDQGNTGSSVDYPFELVNNVTTDDATKALSAAQGVVLDGKISQLGQKVNGLQTATATVTGYTGTNVGPFNFKANVVYKITIQTTFTGTAYIAINDAQGNVIKPNDGYSGFPKTITFTPTADYDGAVLFIKNSGTVEYSIIVKNDTIVDALAKLNTINKIPFCIPSSASSNFIDFDTTTSILTIPSDSVGLLEKINGSYGYKSFPSASINLASFSTSAIIIIWDKSTAAFSAIAYNTALTDSQIYVAGIRKAGEDTQICSFLPWSINGRPYGINTEPNWPYDLIPATPSGGAKYCNLDLVNNTFSIPADLLLYGANIDGSKIYYSTPAVTIDISPSAVASSAIKILFNKSTKSFIAQSYNLAIPDGYQFFAGIRRSATMPGVTCLYPWSINGKPFGIYEATPPAGHTKGVNHRGYNSEAPENTLPAFRLSKQKYFEYVETDLQFTSDGVAVLLHDASINRTARNADGTTISGTVNIADITYAEALTYDFGIAKGSAYEGTKIPTLEQFLALCRNIGLKAYIELKTGTQAQIEACIEMVQAYGMREQVTWISFYPLLLGYVVTKDEYARVGYIVSNTVDAAAISTVNALKTGKNEAFLDSPSYTETDITAAKNAGLPVEVWTVNNAATIVALSPYVSGVTSDSQNAATLLYEDQIN